MSSLPNADIVDLSLVPMSCDVVCRNKEGKAWELDEIPSNSCNAILQ